MPDQPLARVDEGMAWVAGERLPALADEILPIVIVSTVVFELAGPVLERIALGKVGELPSERPTRFPRPD